MRNTLVIVCALAILVWAGPAWGQDANWSYAGDGYWHVGSNWDIGVQPIAALSVGLPDTVEGAGYTVTINQAGAVCSGIEINKANTNLLLTTGGDFTVNGCMTSYKNIDNGLSGGMFEMTGGTAHIAGFRNARWGNNYGSSATVKISGGTLLPVHLTDHNGKIVDCGYRSGGASYRGGTIHVVGSQASITMLSGEFPNPSGGEYGAFNLRGYATWVAEIDSTPVGISKIVCDTSVATNLAAPKGDNAYFLDSAGLPVLDMRRQVGIIPTKDQVFTLLTADYIGAENLVLSPEDVGTWELTIVAGTESGGVWTPPVGISSDPDYVPGYWDCFANNGDNATVTATWKPAFAGDANADGDVDDSDLSILLSNFGDSGAWSAGDFNADVDIDDADLSILLSNFGSVTATTVPEPATLTLLGLGALALIRRRRNK